MPRRARLRWKTPTTTRLLHSGSFKIKFRVLVYRKDGDKLSYVAAGHGHSKNLDVEVNLTPGEYMLFLVLSWVDRDYDVNFSLYGTELVRFKRVYNKNNPYLIA